MKTLVTGGGGFLGGAIVRQLIARGDSVRSFCLHPHPELTELGVEQYQGDLANPTAVAQAVEGCETVYHVAAKPGVWGSYESFYRPNVLGTQNVLNACRQHNVRQLIYTSSPSVVFNGQDMAGVDESAPYPDSYPTHYPQTKAEAEKLVLAANGTNLATVALRPHLIWGPRDNHLVPRILERGRKGQLKRIGQRPCLVDTVYVDNAAAAHLLAAERLKPGAACAGRAYFISNDAPVPVWEMVDRILKAGGLPPVQGSIPSWAAYGVGACLETVYRLCRISAEPRMTRFVAKELSTEHWFDISAAKRDLGYRPEISLDEGLERLARWLKDGSE